MHLSIKCIPFAMVATLILAGWAAGADESAPPAAVEKHKPPTTRPARPIHRRAVSDERVGPPAPARLRLDIFRLQCTPEQGRKFSLDDVEKKAGTVDSLMDALKDVAKVDLLYRIDEQVDLGVNTNLVIGENVPVVQNVLVSKSGQVTPSVTYRDVGCILDISGKWREDGTAGNAADVKMNLEISQVEKSSTTLAGGVILPNFTQAKSEKHVVAPSSHAILFTVQGAHKGNDFEVTGYSGYLFRLQIDKQ